MKIITTTLNTGYIEEEDIAIYCDTAIGYNYKKHEEE